MDMPDFNPNIDDEDEVTTMEDMMAWHGLAAKAVRGVQKHEAYTLEESTMGVSRCKCLSRGEAACSHAPLIIIVSSRTHRKS